MANHSIPPGLPWVGTDGARPEAALLEEHWGPVLCFADLCTTSPAEAVRLAGEAFTQGIDWKRQGARLPWAALLLTAALDAAGQWHAQGRSERLGSELRIWLNAERAAAQRSGAPDQQPRQQPLALRALTEMPEADAALLWRVEVEGRTAPGTAANSTDKARDEGKSRSGIRARDGKKAREREIARVRAMFRESCLRVHAGGLSDEECRAYTRLLDAATRSPNATPSEDLQRHLAGCAECGQAAVCLAPQGGGLPHALVTGVLGWGGPAYLERRRRAAASGKAADEPAAAVSARRQPARSSAVAALALITILALVGVIATADGPSTAEVGSARGVDGAASHPSDDLASSRSLRPSRSSPSPAHQPGTAGERGLRPPAKSSGPGSRTTLPRTPSPAKPPAAEPQAHKPSPPVPRELCAASYRIVTEWKDGFKAEVRVTSRESLNGWTIGWTYPDGQRVNQMWDGTYTQHDGQVTATALSYNESVPSGKPFGVCFLSSWNGQNSAPRSFTLNGHPCQS
jgi:hypothetical protein